MNEEKPPVRRYQRRGELKKAIIANYSLPFDSRVIWRDIADEHKISVDGVYRLIGMMRKEGLLPAEPTGELPPIVDTSKTKADADALWAKIDRGEMIDPAERRLALSRIVADGSDQNKIPAIRELNSMDAAETRGIGPIDPLTDEEKVERAARILNFIGIELATRAMEVAFAEPQENANDGETVQDQDEALHGGSEES